MLINRIFAQVSERFSLRTNIPLGLSDVDGNPPVQKTISLQNTGNMKTIISDIFFGHSRCFGHGFSVPICADIALEPHETYDLQIL